jgi:hypothetical protein
LRGWRLQIASKNSLDERPATINPTPRRTSIADRPASSEYFSRCPVDIPTRGVDDLRKILRGHEAKLANAKKQRDVILIDIRKASAAADTGDQRAGAARSRQSGRRGGPAGFIG